MSNVYNYSNNMIPTTVYTDCAGCVSKRLRVPGTALQWSSIVYTECYSILKSVLAKWNKWKILYIILYILDRADITVVGHKGTVVGHSKGTFFGETPIQERHRSFLLYGAKQRMHSLTPTPTENTQLNMRPPESPRRNSSEKRFINCVKCVRHHRVPVRTVTFIPCMCRKNNN